MTAAAWLCVVPIIVLAILAVAVFARAWIDQDAIRRRIAQQTMPPAPRYSFPSGKRNRKG